ncbi:Uncharacterised protein [Serratia fonticola]|nr:Uncharacterised protein [Serratia fonticola]
MAVVHWCSAYDNYHLDNQFKIKRAEVIIIGDTQRMPPVMLLSRVVPLPLNQPLYSRGAYIQFTLAHLQRHYSITEGFSGKRRLFAWL